MIAQVILAHLVGDYLLQSHWMAVEKVNKWLPAILHGLTYTIPFLFITHDPLALAIIAGTHIIIDHFRLAKYAIWLKNQMVPKKYRYSLAEGQENAGFTKDVPPWLSNWLMIISVTYCL